MGNKSTKEKYMFKNLDEIIKVIHTYSKNVFENKEIDSDMLEFIINNFVKKEYTYDRHKITNDINIFINLFKNNFTKTLNIDDYDYNNKLDDGSYGVIFNYGKYRVIKIIQNEKKYIKLNINNSVCVYQCIYPWMYEFCSYTVVMSILNYIDEITKSKYSKMFSQIYEPFIHTIDEQTIVIGYIMRKYEITLNDEIKQINSMTDLSNGTSHIIDTLLNLRHLNYLRQLNIFITHRDMKTTNIMIHNGDILFIDFSFLSMKIKCKNKEEMEMSKNIGNLVTTNEKYYDVIMFIASLLKYNVKYLKLLGKFINMDVEEQLKNILLMNNTVLLNAFTIYNIYAFSTKYNSLIDDKLGTKEFNINLFSKIIELIKKIYGAINCIAYIEDKNFDKIKLKF